jgi:hypothetical protein
MVYVLFIHIVYVFLVKEIKTLDTQKELIKNSIGKFFGDIRLLELRGGTTT